jgi:hypothetical protein
VQIKFGKLISNELQKPGPKNQQMGESHRIEKKELNNLKISLSQSKKGSMFLTGSELFSKSIRP